MKLGIEDRHALVLGASSGIGAAIAQVLASEGAAVTLVGRDETRTRQVAERIGATPVVADLRDDAAAATIVEQARQAHGEVDILVLNGGGPPAGTARVMTAESAASASALLVQPHVALVGEVLRPMIDQGWGRIIAVGSSGVQQPVPNLALSNVGRAALAGYLKTLAAEVAADGVTVNMVLPGRIATPRLDQVDEATAERTGRGVDDVRSASQASIPVGRYGTPEEFAAVVAFLAGEPASYITGEAVRCDGGLVRTY